MNKKIEMSLETARQMYEGGTEMTKKWLLENFTKEELEPKKGFTWGDSFKGEGFYIDTYSNVERAIGLKTDKNKNLFLTEKHAKSALAFAQLSHIVNKYNDGKWVGNFGYTVRSMNKCTLGVCPCGMDFNLEFYTQKDAETSMEVNRQLWLDYWMID